MTIIEALTDEWMSMAEIERRLGRSALNSGLHSLVAERKVWRRINATVDPWVAEYCRPHDVGNPLIGKSHVGRMAAPVWEAADGQTVPMLAMPT